MIGSRIATEAVSRGHAVTGYTRSGGQLPPGVTAATGDLADETTVKDAATTHDVVLSATGPSRTGESHEPWLAAVQNLVDHAIGRPGRLRRWRRLAAHPRRHPPARLPGLPAGVCRRGHLGRGRPGPLPRRSRGPGLDLRLAGPVIAPGERTGSYPVALDTPAGGSISAEDYAVALVDELEQPRHRRQRFTVAN